MCEVTTVSDETIDRILRRVATWPDVTITNHPGMPTQAKWIPTDDELERTVDPPVEGTLIRVGETVVAGLRDDGLLDLPVDRRLRDHLLTEGRADRHPTAPAADRLSYRITGSADVTGAMWLLRVTHLARCCREGTLSQATVSRRVRLLRLSPELARLVRGDGLTDSPGATDGRRSEPPRRFRD